LQQRCQKYDFVSFVDISFIKDYCATMDFHPNTKGNEMIANEILNNMNYNKKHTSKKMGR